MNTTIHPSHWRNLGIIAHIDAGKTTLTERLLWATGTIHRTGEVHDGAATTDHMALERERGITIGAAAIQCAWTPQGGVPHRLTLIDTPGHVDFAIEVERSLRVLDGAVVVFCAVAGVQPQSETVWHQADRHGVPRLAFINKMDRVGAAPARVLDQMRERLGANVWALSHPVWGTDGQAVGVVHLLDATYQSWAPAEEGEAQPWTPEQAVQWAPVRQRLVEAIADHDDPLLEAVLNEQPLTEDLVSAALRRATLAGRGVPVLLGTAFKNRGITRLLDAITAWLPSPRDRGPVVAQEDELVPVAPDAAAPLAALAFKVTHQAHGPLVFVRVYAGTLSAGDTVHNSRTGKPQRVGRLAVVMAERTREVTGAQAGDIVALLGAKDLTTGDTLSALTHPLSLEPIQTQAPVLAWRLTPHHTSDLIRLGAGLTRLAQEDPSFQVSTDPDTGETLVWGMGELHLEVMVERLRRESAVEVTVGAPRIAYQETPTGSALGVRGLLDKQNGGSGQYALVIVDVAPREDGEVVFIDHTVGGAVPKAFVAATEYGVRSRLQSGPQGYPVVGVTVTLRDGKTHAVDSNDMAFRRAGAMAVEAALAHTGTTLLEPVMRVQVDAPSSNLGAVLNDLQRRGGQVQQVEEGPLRGQVMVSAPLSSLQGYTTTLRSLTQGRAQAQVAFAHYAPVVRVNTPRPKLS